MCGGGGGVGGGEGNFLRDASTPVSRMGASHTEPIHKSGRGAGGDCFIKDFEALRGMYKNQVGDSLGDDIFRALKDKNIELLSSSGKDVGLIEGVYGKESARPYLRP